MNTDVNSTQGEWVGMGQGSEVYRWEALLVERGLVLGFLSAPSGLCSNGTLSVRPVRPVLQPTAEAAPPHSALVYNDVTGLPLLSPPLPQPDAALSFVPRLSDQEAARQCRTCGFNPGVRKTP